VLDDDHYEYIGVVPTSDSNGLPVSTNPVDCRDAYDLDATATIWRRRVTYGPWEAIGSDGVTMRRFGGIVAAEGKPTIDKRIISQGALTLPTEPVPLMDLGADDEPERGSNIVGKFTGFRRHGLFIAVEGMTTLETGEYGVGIDLRDTTSHVDDEGVMHITGGQIAGAHVVQNPAWPYLAVIEVE
jgi:hypothetical protein